jgi:hypothetical protein
VMYIVDGTDFMICVVLLFFVVPVVLAFWSIVSENYRIYREQKIETQKQYDEWLEGVRP